jgi:hypothetical protein
MLNTGGVIHTLTLVTESKINIFFENMVDRASFAFRERLFQSFAPLYLKPFLGIPFTVLGELNQYSYFLSYSSLALNYSQSMTLSS